MIEAENKPKAGGVWTSAARFWGTTVDVATREVTVLVVIVVTLTAAELVVTVVVVKGVVVTVMVVVAGSKPRKVEQKGCKVDEPMMREAEATWQSMAGPPELVALVEVYE